ncbi:MAG: hypothetical protein R3E65_10325 [Steroidobacteraceae bacterium]
METISKTSLKGMTMAAAIALALTWTMSHAFVQSTAVARWVDAAQVAGGVVAQVAEAGSGAAKGSAVSPAKVVF